MPAPPAELAAAFCSQVAGRPGPAQASAWLTREARQAGSVVAESLLVDGLAASVDRAGRLLDLGALLPRPREASLATLARRLWGSVPERRALDLLTAYARWLVPWARTGRDAWLALGVRKSGVPAGVEMSGHLPWRSKSSRPGKGEAGIGSGLPTATASGSEDLASPLRMPGSVLVVETRAAYEVAAGMLPSDGLAVLTDGYPNQAARRLVARLAHAGTPIHFWGNPDVAGFAALQALGPSVQSVLMDRATVLAHRGRLSPLPQRVFEDRLVACDEPAEWETLQVSLRLGGRLRQAAIPRADVARALSLLSGRADERGRSAGVAKA